MNVVFIHQNFPAQFRHIAIRLAKDPSCQIMAICQGHAPKLAQIRSVVYSPERKPTEGIHPYLASTEAHVINGQAVAAALLRLTRTGFQPDVIFGHPGWGELLYVKEVFPNVPLVGFFEFFYRTEGADVGFDAEYPATLSGRLRTRTMNAIHLLSLESADFGITPTRWQRSVFPVEFQHKLRLIHEGVDTEIAVPNPAALLQLPDGRTLSRRDEVVTYVARNLEPYRGFHILMRAVAEICRRRPNAQVLIVGGDGVSYSQRLPGGKSYREKLQAEISIDPKRVHFLGRIAYQQYIQLLQVSSAHIYLTVPFVLSWSMLEAMAAGCLVIGSDTAPVREVIRDGENGLLVDFFSPQAIADAVDRVLEAPDKLQPLRDAARRRIVQSYTISQGIEAYQQLLAEIARQPPATRGRRE